jgi:probable rRNA maturation factor
MIVIDRPRPEVSQRALALFTGKARQAVGLEGDIVIRVTSAREMQGLNRRFRRKNKPTDVLSFPSGLPAGGGDIAIAEEVAAANAEQLGHSLNTELKILILHGLLHLAGYDHESDNGEMTAREAKLRRKLGLPAGLIERTHGASAASGAQVPRPSRRTPRSDVRSSNTPTPAKEAGMGRPAGLIERTNAASRTKKVRIAHSVQGDKKTVQRPRTKNRVGKRA